MQRHPIHGQRGFSLIEVLITVLVVSVGMLGLAALQLASIKNTNSAFLRTQATLATADLIDRMRAQPGLYAETAWTYDGCATGAAAPRSFQDWECLVDTLGLPPPSSGNTSRALVNCQSGNACGAGNCEVVVRWDDGRAERVAAAPTPGTNPPTPVRDVTDVAFRVCSRLL